MLKFIIALWLIEPTLLKAEHVVIMGKGLKKYHTGLLHKEDANEGLGVTHVTLADCENLPDSFDLRTIGTVPDVKDQGSCGSCWAFSKTASLESATIASGKKPLDLSEQELVSCDKSQWGCEGGILGEFKYQINHGQGLEVDMPYSSGLRGRKRSCKAITPAAKGSSFAYVGSADKSPTEKELKCALYKSRTVPWITVSASSAWGSPPSSEKTAYTKCGRGQTNHAVGVVGWWTDSKGKTKFVMKNSWGTSWGDKGYMSMPLGCDSFGDEVAYIIDANLKCHPPLVKLPAEVKISEEAEAVIGVKKAKDVTYEWLVDGDKISDESIIHVSPAEDTIYKLKAKNKCGTSESSVRIKLLSL